MCKFGLEYLNLKLRIALLGSIEKQLFGILISGFVCSIWVLLPERIAEMHNVVILLNFVHILICFYLTFVVYLFFKQKKDKRE
jgi:amino acid transporter